MGWLYSLIGLFLGAFLGGVVFRYEMGWTAAAIGAALGALFGRLQTLGQHVRRLQHDLDALSQAQSVQAAAQEARQNAAAGAARSQAAAAASAAAQAARQETAQAWQTEAPQARPATAPAFADDTAAAAAAEATASAAQTQATAAKASSATLSSSATTADADTPATQTPGAVDFDPLLLPEPPPAPKSGRAVFDIGPAPSKLPPRPVMPPRMPRSAPVREGARKADSPPSPLEVAFDAVKRWFTQGNVPVKIGVLVLFLGVGALMKYAADQGWLRVPMELRMAGIAAAALAGLVFGWRKRESHRAFALSLQGGMIGILLLVVFSSFKQFGLIPAGAAFALLIVIVASAGVMAVAQDALALAVLAIAGGFLAPILTASDSGNHVALFTYYAVLNAAILGIAWVRPWRGLNLLGFGFTFVVGTFWGVLKYRPELFASTEPFLILFYAFYLAIPLLYALRQPDERRGLVDGSLVFGTPLLAFPLQAGLLQGDAHALALSAFVLALTHLGVAAFALRRLQLTLLGQSHALLALGFATLAVPLALSSRATACAWAVEGAALVWLGLRQQRQLPRVIGYVLQLAAGVSLMIALAERDSSEGLRAILNGDFLAITLLCGAGFVCAHLLRRSGTQAAMARPLLLWALFWWLVLGVNEITRFVPSGEAAFGATANWLLGFAALTALLASEAGRRLDWSDLGWPAFVAIALAPLFVGTTAALNPAGPISGAGIAAWTFWFAASLRAQRNLAVQGLPGLAAVHFIHTWTWAGLLCLQIVDFTDRRWQLGGIWQSLGALLPFALAFVAALARWKPLRFPLEAAAERARAALLGTLGALLGSCWVIGLVVAGDPAPLPYLPLLNPLELAQIGFVLALLAWYRQAGRDGDAALDAQLRAQLLAGTGFALLTSITLRSVHFLGGVPWDTGMFQSALTQACLSVVWCLAGLGAMLLGARRASRPIWIGGAALVGLVIVKLILIDRTHLKDLYAILGVLAVGSLLMVVGWFAPNPPKAEVQEPS